MRKLYKGLRILALFGALFFMGIRLANATACPTTQYSWCVENLSCNYTSYSTAFAAATNSHLAQGQTIRATQWQVHSGGNPPYSYYVYFDTNGSYNGQQTAFWPSGSSATSSATDPGYMTCTAEQTPEEAVCAALPMFEGKITVPASQGVTVSNAFCKSSCKHYAAGGVETTNADGTKTFVGNFYPYPGGVTCTAGSSTATPKPVSAGETCTPMGSLSQCYSASTGKMCAVTPRGNKACWTPSENNTKVSLDQKEALAKTVSPAVATAPTTLVNAETNTVTSTTATSPTSTTNVTNNITYSNTTGQPATADSGSGSDGSSTGTDPGSTGSSSGGFGAGDSANLAAVKAATESSATSLDAIEGMLGDETSGNLDARGNDGMAASGEAAGHNEETEYGASGLDQTGMGFGSSCPVIPPLSILGSEVSFDTSLFCQFMTAAGYLVFLFAALGCLRILGGVA